MKLYIQFLIKNIKSKKFELEDKNEENLIDQLNEFNVAFYVGNIRRTSI